MLTAKVKVFVNSKLRGSNQIIVYSYCLFQLFAQFPFVRIRYNRKGSVDKDTFIEARENIVWSITVFDTGCYYVRVYGRRTDCIINLQLI